MIPVNCAEMLLCDGALSRDDRSMPSDSEAASGDDKSMPADNEALWGDDNSMFPDNEAMSGRRRLDAP